jgi:membrane protein implicated in regulation of membrane protease activity
MLLIAQFVFFVIVIVLAYLYWIRPLLHSRPELKDVYARSDGLWSALRLRFAGIKTLLTAAIGMAASAIVALHDFLLPLATGVDWTPVRDLLPAWAWPFILFAMFALISAFRRMTERRQPEGL